MASSFKRRLKVDDKNNNKDASVAPMAGGVMLGLGGTKAWTGGTTLTAFGLRDLDSILGGGQPLGTCILMEEDRWTRSLASALVRYWCAEALAQDQHLLIPIVEGNESAATNSHGPSREEVLHFLSTLPFNLHWDKQHKTVFGDTAILETLDEDEEESNEEGLQIAWQYRKNVQQQRLGHVPLKSSTSSDVYCHSYDLSRQMSVQWTLQQKPPLEESVCIFPAQCLEDTTNKRSSGFALYQQLWRQIQALCKAGPPRKVVRLLLYHVHPETTTVALPLLLVQIRLFQLPVVVMIGLQAWKSPHHSSSFIQLRRASDVVLQVEGFAARRQFPPPAEFRHLHGLLVVAKINTWTGSTAGGGGGHYADSTMTKRPPATIYGLHRDRRKLHVSLLHIPPEDHAAKGGSVGGGGVRSGAGKPPSGGGCSGNGSSQLDF